MSLRSTRHRAEYLAYRGARRLIGLLPLSLVRRLGRLAGGLYYLVGRERRRVTLANLRHVFPDTRERHGAIARGCFRAYGAIFFETLHAYAADPERLRERFTVEGLEHLDAALAQGRGCLLATGHFGNWELALWPLGPRLGEIHVVARAMTNPAVDRDVEALRTRVGYRLLGVKSAGFRMLKILRRGGHVALVFDQRVKPRNGILVPFLGRRAWLTPLLASLSIHTGAPVVPVFCVPQGADRYRVSVLPAIHPEGRGLDAEAVMTRRCLEPLERRVRETPELWLWMHRLWRVVQRDRRAEVRALNRRRSGLGPEPPPVAPPVPAWARPAIETEFLERAQNAVAVVSAEEATRAAVAVVEALLREGHRARLTTPAEIGEELGAARAASELARVYRELDTCDLLVIDGLGREPLAPGVARELVELFVQRRDRRSTLVTTGVPVAEWERIFGDPATTRAARERLADDALLLQ